MTPKVYLFGQYFIGEMTRFKDVLREYAQYSISKEMTFISNKILTIIIAWK